MNYPRNPWVEKLWREAEKAAKGKSGPEIVRALEDASDKVWRAGLDHAYASLKSPVQHWTHGFDTTWLSFFIAEIRGIR